MSKTPAEIKKELRNAKHVQCMDISDGENECAGTRYGVLIGYVLRDGIYIYITQLESDNESKQKRIEELESRLAQVEREKDAAVADLEKYKGCGTCKFQDVQFECDDYQSCAECDNADCPCYGISVDNCWQWRGVCEGGNT